jgi:AhpD family alkylhydroperoxidase
MAETKKPSIVNVITVPNPVVTALDSKTRELIAVSASVAGNCIPCLRYHLAEAAKKGCTKEELQEVVELANMIKQSPTDRINATAAKYLQKQ